MEKQCIQCNNVLELDKFWKSQSRCIPCMELNRKKSIINLEDCYVKAVIQRRTKLEFTEQHPELIEEARNVIKFYRKYENHKTHKLCTVCYKPKRFSQFSSDVTKKDKKHPHCLICARKAKRTWKENMDKLYGKNYWNGGQQLTDSYIKCLITAHNSGLKTSDIPNELIELKREQIKLRRIMKDD